MPTTKTRVNVSISSDMERALFALAKRDQVPHATKAGELLRMALEIEEDGVLNAIAHKRDKASVRYVSHEQAWQ
jgi:citrate lyase gamma subunit